MQVEGYESCTGVESQRQILLPLDLDLKSEFPKPPSSPTSPGFLPLLNDSLISMYTLEREEYERT